MSPHLVAHLGLQGTRPVDSDDVLWHFLSELRVTELLDGLCDSMKTYTFVPSKEEPGTSAAAPPKKVPARWEKVR